MGTAPQEAVARLEEAGVHAVGTNCCNGMADAIEIIKDMSKVASKALIAQPNAGVPEFEGGRAVYRQTPEVMAEGIEGLLGNGVRMVGGCCGTTPAHIRKMGLLLGKC